MRKALEQLGREKLIVRRQGRGTFVESVAETRHGAKASWHLEFDRRHKLNENISTIDLNKEIATPSEQEAAALEITRLSKAVRVQVLATWQDHTSSIDTFVIPLSTFQSQNVEFDIVDLNIFNVVQQIEPHVSRYVDKLSLVTAHSETRAHSVGQRRAAVVGNAQGCHRPCVTATVPFATTD